MKHHRIPRLFVLLASLLIQTGQVLGQALPSTFVGTGSMTAQRSSHTATLLQNGKVLVAGGFVNHGTPTQLSTAELYDPLAGTFTSTGSMAVARSSHTATLLLDGRVLVAGGLTTSAELYDPSSGTFSTTGSMVAARSGHTATLLPNGWVLITGGQLSNGSYVATAELYFPSSGTFGATGSMAQSQAFHTATLLPSGKVLVAGQGSFAELYDPVSGTFSPTGSMITPRYSHTATLLPGGAVLIAGGGTNPNSGGDTTSAEIYDPAAGTFSPTGSTLTPRFFPTATLLPNGTVLLAGGFYFPRNGGSAVGHEVVEVYDPATGKFVGTALMSTDRSMPTATLLPGAGGVLIAGGWSNQYGNYLSTAEIYRLGPEVFVANFGSGNVTVIDSMTNTTVQTVQVGSAPLAIATTPTNAYVTNSGDGTVSVIDITRNTAVGSPIPVGAGPSGIAIPSVTQGAIPKAYVANYAANTVSVIDTGTNMVVGTPIPVGTGPVGIAVTPQGDRVYVANTDGSVSVIDTMTNAVIATVQVPTGADGVVLTVDGKHVLVTSLAGYLTVIDTASNTITGRPVSLLGATPFGLAIYPDGSRIYIMLLLLQYILVTNTDATALLGLISPGHFPTGIGFMPGVARGYLSNFESGSVSLFDTSTSIVVNPNIPVGTYPVGIAISHLARGSGLFQVCPPQDCQRKGTSKRIGQPPRWFDPRRDH